MRSLTDLDAQYESPVMARQHSGGAGAAGAQSLLIIIKLVMFKKCRAMFHQCEGRPCPAVSTPVLIIVLVTDG